MQGDNIWWFSLWPSLENCASVDNLTDQTRFNINKNFFFKVMACRLYDDGPTFDIRNRPFIFLSHGVQSGRTYKFRFSFLIAKSLSKILALSSQRLSVCLSGRPNICLFLSSLFFSSKGQFFSFAKDFPIFLLSFSSPPSIADISHNNTTGNGVLFSSWCTF